MTEHPKPAAAPAPSPAPAPAPSPVSGTSLTPEIEAAAHADVWRPTKERAEPAKETPMDTPKCPECEGRTQPYQGTNPHKQGSYECPKCQLRVRQG